MAALNTIYEPSLTGDSKAYVAADVAGDTVPNDGRTILHYKNTNAATRTVTVAGGLCNYGGSHNSVTVVGATTGDELIGPFSVARFGSTLVITYDAVTNLTVAPIRVPLA